MFAGGGTVVAPTASSVLLGQGKWDVGPSFVILKSRPTWLAGVQVAQNWSVTGVDGRPGVSRLLVTPFATWYVNRGWYLLTTCVMSADWNEEPERRWTVPIGGGVGHIVRRGKHAFNFTVQAYYNVTYPSDAARWQLRLTTSWVMPKT
jgi:hypothetical protein